MAAKLRNHMTNRQGVTQKASTYKTVFFVGILAIVSLLLFEILSAAALHYIHQSRAMPNKPSKFSSINFLHKVGIKLGYFDRRAAFKQESSPKPFLIADPNLGYSAKPGAYAHIYHRKSDSESDWESLRIKVTINQDRSRWTGKKNY